MPLPLRNRLAELILESLHDRDARRGLEALAAVCADPRAVASLTELPEAFPREWFERREGGVTVKGAWAPYAPELAERSGRAWRTLRTRPLDAADATLEAALGAAATLFDAGLYYEVHEHLEPYWLRAEGDARGALQGLIQIAVGFQHLANGNAAGARALLTDGCAKIRGRSLEARDLDRFGQAVERAAEQVRALGEHAPRRFDWTAVPRFPTRA